MAINDVTLNYETLGGEPPSFEQTNQYQNEIYLRVLSRLTHQFKEKENIAKYLEYYLEGMGEVRNEENSLLLQRSLATAVGDNLDILGVHLGVIRDGRTDADYRRALFISSLIGASEGTREDVIGAVRIQSGGSKIRYWDIFPAALQIFTDGTGATEFSAELVKEIVPAGVNSQSVVIASHGEVPFVLSESLPANPTLILDNGDDYITDTGNLIELRVPSANVTTTPYGGGLGETDSSTGLPLIYEGGVVGYPLSESYQV